MNLFHFSWDEKNSQVKIEFLSWIEITCPILERGKVPSKKLEIVAKSWMCFGFTFRTWIFLKRLLRASFCILCRHLKCMESRGDNNPLCILGVSNEIGCSFGNKTSPSYALLLEGLSPKFIYSHPDRTSFPSQALGRFGQGWLWGKPQPLPLAPGDGRAVVTVQLAFEAKKLSWVFAHQDFSGRRSQWGRNIWSSGILESAFCCQDCRSPELGTLWNTGQRSMNRIGGRIGSQDRIL